MSWISDLAGKAESLLERVDKTAHTALQKDGQSNEISGDSSSAAVLELGSDVTAAPPATRAAPELPAAVGNMQRSASAGTLMPGHPNAPVKTKPLTASARSPPRVKKEKKSDDQLFEFLNSSPAISKDRKVNKPKVSSEDSVPAVNQSEILSAESRDAADGKEAPEPVIQNSSSTLVINVSAAPEVPSPEEPVTQSIPHAAQPATKAHHHATDRVSNLELENKLLRQEVTSLNEELVSVVQRAKESEKGKLEAEGQLRRVNGQQTATENIVRQLQLKEEDFNEALAAKDSQLAVLRVRLQEVDQELKAKRALVDELQLQKEQLLKDHSDSTGMQSHAFSTLENKYGETERKLKIEMEAHQKTQQEAMESQSMLKQEQLVMAESLKNLQKKLNEEKNQSSEHMAAVKLSKANLETARQELKDYKDKAQRILQAKDKVINSLREGGKGGEMSGISSSDYEEVCREKDLMREELNQTKYRVEQLKGDLQDMEHQLQSEADLAEEKIQNIENAFEEEKHKREECEQALHHHVQELRFAQEEINRTKMDLMAQIQEREREIEKMRNQLATKSLTSTSEEEMENRMRTLTENLIHKQTTIEALSTEKNSLVLQLERLEQQYRDVQLSAAKLHTNTAVTGFDDSDENTLSRVRSISSIMPSKLNDSRRMKTAVNEIDKCSIRLGTFLRRYPIARLFVILYMALLHVWVLIVLLTYKPEVHDANPVGMPQPNVYPHS